MFRLYIRIILFLVIFSSIFYIVFKKKHDFFYDKESQTENTLRKNTFLGPISSRSHTIGNAKTYTVRLDIFSEVECPFCASFIKQSVPRLVKHHGDNLLIVYHYFPDILIRPNSLLFSEIQECTYKQTNDAVFWLMLNEIFEKSQNKKSLQANDLYSITKKYTENDEAVKNCVNTNIEKEYIMSEYKKGLAIGVSLTPSILVSLPNTEKNILLLGGTYTQVEAAIIELQRYENKKK